MMRHEVPHHSCPKSKCCSWAKKRLRQCLQSFPPTSSHPSNCNWDGNWGELAVPADLKLIYRVNVLVCRTHHHPTIAPTPNPVSTLCSNNGYSGVAGFKLYIMGSTGHRKEQSTFQENTVQHSRRWCRRRLLCIVQITRIWSAECKL